jgi:LacI family transcriptional regulator, repressor for deo operon, udp, cdd, tsx, nupC, and nupG
LVANTDFSKESTHQAMVGLLALKNPPKAIVTFNDYVHMDAVQYALQQNIKVNRDIIFVSYANLSITSYTEFPPLVSIEQYPYGQGEKAMEIMIKIINDRTSGKASTFYTEEMPGTLVMHPYKIR